MGILIAVLIFGLVVFIHELGHFLVAKKSGIQVNEFSIGMGPKIISKNVNNTDYSLRLFPIGGFVAMEGEDEESESENSFSCAPVESRIAVVVAGAIMNLILGFVVLTILINSSDAIASKTVSSFYENSSSQATGLQIGDEIVAINGRKCYIIDDIFYEFARTQDGEAEITVMRDGKREDLNIVFETEEIEEGFKNMVVDFTVLPKETTMVNVLTEAFNQTISLARMIFLSAVDLVTGNVPMNQLSGPVGIVSTISEAVNYGWQSVMMLLAMITINLGVFNLLPFPALDGGRLVFLLVELLRGKPVPQKYEFAVNAAGMAILLTFMVFVTFSDVTRFFR